LKTPRRRKRATLRAAHLVARVVFVVAWALLGSLGAPRGAGAQVLEQQVKAAFLFRFLSFVEWPAEALGAPGAPLVVAVVGADDVHAELEQIVAGRTVGARPVLAMRLKEGERPAGAHVLFVGRRAAPQLRRFAAQPAVLLVGESEDALADGAMINFVVRDARVRFEVAPDEAERRGLRIGARMLAVASHVRGGPARPSGP